MRAIKFFFHILQGVVIACIAMLGFVLITGYLDSGGPVRGYIILSGSMEPELPVGSVVFVGAQPVYTKGDVVTFSTDKQGKDIVTHRIHDVTHAGAYYSDPVFTTKGDANKSPDQKPIPQSHVRGRVFLSIPYLGYAADFAKTPRGFVFLVIVPATIIIYEELKTVGKELSKAISRARKTVPDPVPSTSGMRRFPVAVIAVPVIGAMLVAGVFARSYFSDLEKIAPNILGVAADFGITPTPVLTPGTTPTPQPSVQAVTLVINEVLPDSSCEVGNTEAQWLEVYNGYPDTVDLKNFSITDGTDTIDLVTAANTNVESGGFALLAHNSAIWNSCYDDNSQTTANLGGQLDIDTGTLQLLDSTDTVIDTVQWGGASGIDPAVDQSVERDPDGKDTATGTGFAASDFVVRQVPQPGQ